MPTDEPYETILFDLDNTLIPFLGPLRRWAQAWAEAASPADPDPVREALLEATLEDTEDPRRAERLVADRFDVLGAEQASETARRAYWRALTPYPGIRATLARLDRAGVTLGVVTDAPRKRAAVRLSATQLTRRFDVVVTRDDTDGGKTSARPFRLALEALDEEPSRAAMVGDWPAFDVRWPNRIGMDSVLAAWGTGALPDHARCDARPDHVAEDPRDLSRLALDEHEHSPEPRQIELAQHPA